MDAVTLLNTDHKTVDKLFKQLEKAGPTADQTRRTIADTIIRELFLHAAIEEQYFYPAVRDLVPAEEDWPLSPLSCTTSSSGCFRNSMVSIRTTSDSGPRLSTWSVITSTRRRRISSLPCDPIATVRPLIGVQPFP